MSARRFDSRLVHRTPAPALLVGLAAGCSLLAVLAWGCSKDNSTAPIMDGGPVFNFTFPQTGTSHQAQISQVGTWGYRCTTHGGMTGTIIVSASSTNDSGPVVQVGFGNANQFNPASVTIKPNGFVRWVNVSSATNHNVTRP